MGSGIKVTGIKKQFLSAGILYFGQFILGFTMGWTGPVVPKLQNAEETPLDRVITDAEASCLLSISFIGIIGGPYISGCLCNTVGRKACLYFGGCMFCLSYILMALAKSLVMIYIGRALVGVGVGVLFVTNLIYIGEMASTKIRGMLLALTGFQTTQAIMSAYTMGSYISYAQINWMIAFLSAEYVVFIYFLVPESAVYQVMKGKKEEAMATLKKLGRQDDIDEVLSQADDKPKSKMAQLTEMYTVKSNRKAAFIIISLNILTQLSGMIVVTAFVSVIFETAVSDLKPHTSTIIIGATHSVASIIVPILVDRAGRKVLLLVSCAVCSLSLFSLGTYFYLYDNGYPIAEDLKWLSLASIMIFCVAYSSGMGIIPYVFVGEMFTDTCRSFGGTITVTFGWAFVFAVSTKFSYVLPVWGPSVVYWLFSGACAFAFFFTVVFVPETKGKSLSEVRELLSK